MKQIPIIITLFLFCTIANAQNPLDPGWLWAERGGGAGSFNYLSDAEYERIVDIAVDSENNYYYLAEVSGYTFTLGDMEFDTYNDLAQYRDILVFSTDGDGIYRWSKIIGGGWDDIGASSIGVDEVNNVYVSGSTINIEGNTAVHFDTDTVMGEGTNISGPNNKRAFLIKYDSEGNFQWLNQPEGEEVSFGGSASWAKTVTEPNGHTHSLVWFWAGTHLNGQLIVETDSSQATILNYDENGDLLNFIPLNMKPEITAPYNYQLAYDPNLERYYIADTYKGNAEFLGIDEYGGDNNAFYLAAVNNQCEVLWYHQDGVREFNTTGDLKLDNEGNIYFSGFFVTLNADEPNTFAGYDFDVADNGTIIKSPFLIKLDSEGNLIWGTNSDLYSPFNGQSIVVDGNNVYLGLSMLLNTWDDVDIPAPTGQGLVPDIQIIRFDAETGIAQEAIFNNETTPTRDAIMAMALDNNGDLIVGGYFGSSLFAGTDLHIQNTGPDSDFFIAKYHLQDSSGVGIADHAALQDVRVYPNPTNGVLNLQSPVLLSNYTLCDLQGRIVKRGSLVTNQVDMSGLESGVYVLGVRGVNGGVRNFKVLKE